MSTRTGTMAVVAALAAMASHAIPGRVRGFDLGFRKRSRNKYMNGHHANVPRVLFPKSGGAKRPKLTHKYLDRCGIPRKKDGNKLGLRKRDETLCETYAPAHGGLPLRMGTKSIGRT